MADRVREMRSTLHAELVAVGCPPPARTTGLEDWSHVLNQVGMFTLTGLTKGQVEYLQKEHRVYMPADGRICVAALYREACAPLARAMKDAIEKVKDD